MLNSEKFKTAEERAKACKDFLKRHDEYNKIPYIDAAMMWLELEAEEEEEEKPLPCPFCGGTYFNIKIVGQYSPRFRVDCGCGYCGGWKKSESEAIAAHNRVAKAVMDAEKEV